MTDENMLLRQRTRGQKTQRLWDDPIIQGFFRDIEEDIRRGWGTSTADEKDRREEIYYLYRAVEELKQRFKTYIATGKLAAAQLEATERERERATGNQTAGV